MSQPPQPQAPARSAIYLAGPTGSGKSAVAVALASRMENTAIVNADAFQIYAGYEILSAAPPERAREQIPHHLYGHLKLSETCDVARYAELACPLIARLLERGIRPIIVGGSGLYLKALTHGLADTPPADSALRRRLDVLDLDQLVAWYRAMDPEGAAITNLRNRRYVTRNLEISLLSGQAASGLKRDFARPDPVLDAFILERDREHLYERINARTVAMFDEGVIDEVASLADTSISITAEKAIGLAEIRSVLAGTISREEAIARISQSTRRYAKRQATWFRREKVFQSVCLHPTETPESAAGKILPLLSAPQNSR